MSDLPTRPAFVCTVHIDSSPFWATVQPEFLRRYFPGATLVAAAPQALAGAFDHTDDSEGEHKDKLDLLAQKVVHSLATNDNDLLVFFDGDAFPIRPLWSFVEAALADVPLAAICREEMPDEDFPHPSFCVTTVGFWRDIGGDWQLSADATRVRNDLGCHLLETLNAAGVRWRRILRSNAFNPHPVMFGIYGETIYHHGTGFRRPVTLLDRAIWRDRAPSDTWTDPEKYRFFFDVVASGNAALSDTFKRLIAIDPDFHRVLELGHPEAR